MYFMNKDFEIKIYHMSSGFQKVFRWTVDGHNK